MKTCTLEAAERETIIKALSQTSGHITKSAEILGISRQTLYDKISKHSICIGEYKIKKVRP